MKKYLKVKIGAAICITWTQILSEAKNDNTVILNEVKDLTKCIYTERNTDCFGHKSPRRDKDEVA